jgi:hypothetical protein
MMALMCLGGERALLESKINEKAPLLFKPTNDGTQLDFVPIYICRNSVDERSDKVPSTIQAVKDPDHLYALRKVWNPMCAAAKIDACKIDDHGQR